MRRIMMKPILLAAVGAAALALVISIFPDGDPSIARSAPELTVTVVRPQRGSIAETMTATGMTIPREDVRVTTELTDVRVRDVLVEVGDRVEKGQTLAVLDGASFANQRRTLRSEYERAYDAFSRVDRIKDTGAVSQQRVAEKRSDMHAAKAKLDDADLKLSRSTVVAPAAGVVFERNAAIGGLAADNEPLFRIVRHGEIEMEARIPESFLSALGPDLPAVVMLAGHGTTIEGTIRRIEPRVDAATRMGAVRIRLHGAKSPPVGLFATAKIVLSNREGLLLPRTALQHDGDGDFVWTLSVANTAERLPVEVTRLGERQIMIAAIPPDARVVARAGEFLKEGERIRAVEDK